MPKVNFVRWKIDQFVIAFIFHELFVRCVVFEAHPWIKSSWMNSRFYEIRFADGAHAGLEWASTKINKEWKNCENFFGEFIESQNLMRQFLWMKKLSSDLMTLQNFMPSFEALCVRWKWFLVNEFGMVKCMILSSWLRQFPTFLIKKFQKIPSQFQI